MIKNIGHYAKSYVPLIIAALTAVLGYFEDGVISTAEQQTIAAALVTWLGVLILPNAAKTAVVPAAPAPVPPDVSLGPPNPRTSPPTTSEWS
jgi:hypothetical protein